MLFTTLFVAASSLSTALASSVAFGKWGMHLPLPPDNAATAPNPLANTKLASFDQLIDHKNPSLGTFAQRYWYNVDHWGGPGYPVILMTPGEIDATNYTRYTTNLTLTGMIGQRIGGAVVVLEHRYWGKSSPYPELTTASLQQLTLDNSIADLTNFAKTVKLPFAQNASSNADAVPWVLVGGSYSGALTAWTESLAPGTFWASLASSAPVEAISDFWEYFNPVQRGMPQNCSTDLSRVIDYLDRVMTTGSASEVQQIKQKFGLPNVQHNDDFMAALENGPWTWQSNSPRSDAGFMQFCNYVENVFDANTTTVPGAGGVGLQKALDGYAKWFTEIELPGFCSALGMFSGDNNTDCFNTYDGNSPMFTTTAVDNDIDRAWIWMTCNEPFGWWQDGAPRGRPSIVSRLVNAQWSIRQCGLYFPPGPNGETYGIAKGKTEDQLNARTKGWNIDECALKRIIFTNGEFDPWRAAGTASGFRPRGQLQPTDQVKTNLIPGGVHCYDLIAANGVADPRVGAVQQREIEQIAEWIAQWPKKH
ncbi:putative serine peptidase [Myriangium duriaei CBS 260.36]|uniref:Serine peptidase n=1 Tax=Myriangium duriaei CBS 260.36 TaxID=1168546 RepID=A0A9P4MJN9_9PEZI|nr:putative serine peptidase [Myriangium duriaei CBS 260.36]